MEIVKIKLCHKRFSCEWVKSQCGFSDGCNPYPTANIMRTWAITTLTNMPNGYTEA